MMPTSPSPFPRDLSPSDRLMWRMERDPVLRSPIMVVGLLDRDPDQDAVRTTLDRAAGRLPRLRQVIATGGPLGRSIRWQDDPGFAIDYHVRRVRAPAPANLRAVLDVAGPWVTSAFDPARPEWECTIVEGLDEGRAAFVLRFHHTITDGVGGVDLAGVVFDATRDGQAPPTDGAGEDALAAGTPREDGRGLVESLFAAARRPLDTAADVARFVRSLGRMLEPAPESLSPVMRDRGLDRHLNIIDTPMSGMLGAARAWGCTVNDVFLAAVAGGLHHFHARLGHRVPALRVTMPISLRRPGDPPGGNRFTPARFVLPIDDPDPARRARIANGIAHRWRDEPAVGMSLVIATVLDQLPAAAVASLFGSLLKHVDIDVVDVPGLRRDAYVGGARIERMWAFAPPAGAALSVTLLSHLDRACIGVATDLAAVEDPDLLLSCLETGLEETLDAARSATGAGSGGEHGPPGDVP